LNKKGQLTATASPAQPRRPEILRLATATAFYGGGGNFLRLATAYELYGGLRRRVGGLTRTKLSTHSFLSFCNGWIICKL